VSFLALLDRIGSVIRTILGVPNYQRYVAHVRAAHPGEEPLSEKEFFKRQLEGRAKPGARCC
jgi:uncharacterized short protein YbdD (DUF466 family)